jgi:hypothetical protein
VFGAILELTWPFSVQALGKREDPARSGRRESYHHHLLSRLPPGVAVLIPEPKPDPVLNLEVLAALPR